MNIEIIIEKYEGKTLDYEELDELGFEECVECIEYNGRSGIDSRLDWYSIYFINGQSIEVYTR